MLKTCIPNEYISRPNPSLFWFPGLYSQALYADNDEPFTQITHTLQSNYDIILNEYQAICNQKIPSDYISSDSDKLHHGNWDWNSYILKGERQTNFALHCPRTVEILETFKYPSLMMNTPFSFAFFSNLKSKSKIDAHCSPMNLRIRCHFPLIIPKSGDFGMKIGNKVIKWEVNKPVYFDDCYEHQVWNNTDEDRVVFLFDLWHPDLHASEIEMIIDMFSYANKQGWTKKK